MHLLLRLAHVLSPSHLIHIRFSVCSPSKFGHAGVVSDPFTMLGTICAIVQSVVHREPWFMIRATDFGQVGEGFVP